MDNWTASLWISLAGIFAFFAIGAAVNVAWGKTSIPVSAVVTSIDWSRVSRFYLNEEFAVFALAGCLASLYTLTSSWRLRFSLMVIGLISPLVIIDPEIAIVVMAFAPFAVFGALTGQVNGEFYVDDLPVVTAVGLWMLICLVFAVYQLHRARAEYRRTSAQRSAALT